MLVLLWPGLCQAVAPRLNYIVPPGGQRGAELTVRFAGERLEDAQEIVFYEPGLKVGRIEAANDKRVKVILRIAADCRLGEHHVRVRTATGVSDLRTFWVGPFPTTEEQETNNTPDKAQSVAMNSTVAGVIEAEDTDCFRVAAREGQRISAEIEAMRLGRRPFDPLIAILDASGTTLATSDDSTLLLQDSAVSILAPADGAYVIQVRESSYGGNTDFLYRLHVGDFPRPTAVFPAGGQPGQTLSVTFLGDPTGPIFGEIALPATAPARFGAFAEAGGVIAPSPNWLRVSPFPNVLEAPPNQSRAQATAAEPLPPLALNGVISKQREEDWFKFKARKDQALEVNVYARRLRSPLDSVLTVFDAKGDSIASSDDASGADSSVKFTPADDGEYFVRVKDHLSQGGPDYVYRVEITPASPSVTLSIPQAARNDSQTRQYIVVPKGNRFATVISARRSNFNGDLAFGIDGLPRGVAMHAETMPARIDAMPLVFEAVADAPVSGRLLELGARPVSATDGFRSSFRHNVELVQGPNNTTYYSTSVDQLYVAVTEPAPFKIRILEPKVPLVQNGTMDLKIIAERSAGFEEPIMLKFLWNPPGIGSLPDVAMRKRESSGEYRLNAGREAALGSWPVAVLASATVNGGTVWVSSQLARLEVGEPYVLGKIGPVTASPGETAKLVCKLEQKRPFEGKAKVKLMGLPEKVTAEEVEITKESTEVTFHLSIDPKMPLSSHRRLFCAVDIRQGDEVIPHTVGQRGVLRIVPPKDGASEGGKVAAKEGAK
jgi:hypothetical protein